MTKSSANVHFLGDLNQGPKKEKYSSSTAPEITHAQALLDIENLTLTELRVKYKLTYDTWRNMKLRRKEGAIISQEFDGFKDFLRYMGPRTCIKYTIDRIDCNDRTYGPGLCRWADKHTQNQNKANNVFLPYKGENLTMSAWAARTGQLANTLYKRKQNGWTDSEIITGKREGKPSPAVRRGISPWPIKDAAKWEAAYQSRRKPDETKLYFYIRMTRLKLANLKAEYEEMDVLPPRILALKEELEAICARIQVTSNMPVRQVDWDSCEWS
jgi:hypothetical protein